MASRWVRRSAAGLVVAGAVGIQAAAAGAGGGDWLDPARDRYEPGQTVTMIGYGTVAGLEPDWQHTDYHAFLQHSVDDWEGDVPPGEDLGWPGVPLGRVAVEEVEPHWGANARVSVEFPLPDDLAPGLYVVDVCTAGCRAPLAWFVPSNLYVGVDPASPVVRDWPLTDPAIHWLEDEALLGTANGSVTAADVRAGRITEPVLTPGVPTPAHPIVPIPTTAGPAPAPGARDHTAAAARDVADARSGTNGRPDDATGPSAEPGPDQAGDATGSRLVVGGAALALALAAGAQWAMVTRARRTRRRQGASDGQPRAVPAR